MKYTEKVVRIVERALASMENLSGQIKELDRRFKAGEVASTAYQQQRKTLTNLLSSARLDAGEKIQAASMAYREMVEKGAELDSSMLHDDAKLLQLDMKMTARQFEMLAEKHKDNPLMVRLLWEYSNKHEGLYPGCLPTTEAKIREFTGFVEAAMTAIREPDSLRTALFLTGQYTPQICPESE